MQVPAPAPDPQPDPRPADEQAPWWRSAVVYQIYPRSFADLNGDGVGDLPGILDRLDYLSWLGVDAIWISPFFPSPMKDFGYDVANYCDVDPIFGTLADFDSLLEAAHRRGIRVLIDWVPNHTSSEHPWFLASRSAREDPKRDWYIWRDPGPQGEPNNWIAAFTNGPAWTMDERTGQYYLHLFLPEQPDLNWANPEVEAAMHDTLRFWLDRGVDGFRMDVIHAIGKDQELPDDPPELLALPHSATNDVAETHVLLRRIRALIDSYPGDRVSVGEVFLLSTAKVARYYGEGDELHLAFNFPPLFAPWQAPAWHKRITRVEEELGPRSAWPTWVLSNHDNPRHRSRYGSDDRARATAVLLLSLRGTAFLYAGEELGLEDAVIPLERLVDPGGRDGARAALPWEREAPHGWNGREPWLPFPPQPGERSVESQRQDPASVLHLYRRLLAARRASSALQLGSLTVRPEGDGLLVYERSHGSDRRVVAINFGLTPTPLPDDLLTGSVIEVASDGIGEGGAPPREIAPDRALLLRRS